MCHQAPFLGINNPSPPPPQDALCPLACLHSPAGIAVQITDLICYSLFFFLNILISLLPPCPPPPPPTHTHTLHLTLSPSCGRSWIVQWHTWQWHVLDTTPRWVGLGVLQMVLSLFSVIWTQINSVITFLWTITVLSKYTKEQTCLLSPVTLSSDSRKLIGQCWGGCGGMWMKAQFKK